MTISAHNTPTARLSRSIAQLSRSMARLSRCTARHLRKACALLPLLCLMVSCADGDVFSTASSVRLSFSADTLMMDTVFSKIGTPTYSLTVYNRSGESLRCGSIRLQNGNQTGFRVNVDGEYLSSSTGYLVNNVEVRKGDSLRVFVELTAAENGVLAPQLVEDNLVFTLESGVQQMVNLRAYTWDTTTLTNATISSDTTINSPERPVVVYGSLRVDSAATLTIAAGTTLYFHSSASLDVYGTLLCAGTAGSEVTLRGDRLDNMFSYLPYDNVSGQWQGVTFRSSSYNNELSYTDLHGAMDGIVCDSSDVSKVKLQLYNSTVHNCQGYGLKAINSVVDMRNSQLSNTLNDCVAIYGGCAMLLHCTLAQFYPFDSNRGAALRYANFLDDSIYPLYQMDCINSIVTGYADDVIMGEATDSTTYYTYRFINSILRTPEVEDSTETYIQNVIWEPESNQVESNKTNNTSSAYSASTGSDSSANASDGSSNDSSDGSSADSDVVRDADGEDHFVLVDLNLQRYDFRLNNRSTAIGAANTSWALDYDRLGQLRDSAPDIGCYEYEEEEDEE